MLLTIVIALLLVPAIGMLVAQYLHHSLDVAESAEVAADAPRELAEAA